MIYLVTILICLEIVCGDNGGIIVSEMQYNYLANFLMFYAKLSKSEWFHNISYLQTHAIIKLPPKRFRFRHFETKKQLKTVLNFKEKIIKQEFDLLILEDEDFAFITNKERTGLVGNPEGSAALISPSFVQKMTTNAFLGQKVLVIESSCVLYGIHWQGYLIFYAEVPQNQVMLFIQQINAITTCRKVHSQQKQIVGIIRKQQDSYHVQLLKYMRHYFEPILCHLFGEKQCEELIKQYMQQLRHTIQHHPQVVKTIDKNKDEIDYTLILYFGLANALKQK